MLPLELYTLTLASDLDRRAGSYVAVVVVAPPKRAPALTRVAKGVYTFTSYT